MVPPIAKRLLCTVLPVLVLALADLVHGVAAAEQQAFTLRSTSNQRKEVPVIMHDKGASHGYHPGSPLYRKQQRVKADLAFQDGPQGSTGTNYDGSSFRPSVSSAVPPVSTTLQCIINLTCQYFLVYTGLAIARLMNTGPANQPSMVATTLASAATTVNYAPMLCVLFLATRMRAVQLTQTETEKYDLPQWWVQVAMHVCTWSVLAQLVIVMVLPFFTGAPVATDNDGNSELPPNEHPFLVLGLTVLRYGIMLALYGGFITVCVGAIMMTPPEEVYPDGNPPISAAVSCVINLSVQYFVVYLLLAIFRTMNQIRGLAHSRASDIFQLAAYTVNFAPMLCVLFIGARMRALQIDPKHGNPQWWATYSFYACTYSVLVQTVLVVAVPVLFGGKAHKGTAEGDITFEISSPMGSMILSGIRWVALLGLYGGFTAVLVSVYLIQNEKEPEKTPPVSPTMQCVFNLSCQFFGVYLCLWLAITIRQSMSQGNDQRQQGSLILEMLEAACLTVMFCPMLCVLFIGCRLRALQMTNFRGAPQGWAQDCMRFASWAVLGQLVMTVVSTGISGRNKEELSDEADGFRPKSGPIGGRLLAGTMELLRFLCMAAMYAGAIGVLVAILVMSPDTATGYGAQIDGKGALLAF